MRGDASSHNILTNPSIPIAKRKRGAQPGNNNRQRHGLRSKEWLKLRTRIWKEIRQTRALLGTARAK
jgi:hypothetical protein